MMLLLDGIEALFCMPAGVINDREGRRTVCPEAQLHRVGIP